MDPRLKYRMRQNALHHSQKLEVFLDLLKAIVLGTSNYLDLTRGTADRKKLVKLQIK